MARRRRQARSLTLRIARFGRELDCDALVKAQTEPDPHSMMRMKGKATSCLYRVGAQVYSVSTHETRKRIPRESRSISSASSEKVVVSRVPGPVPRQVRTWRHRPTPTTTRTHTKACTTARATHHVHGAQLTTPVDASVDIHETVLCLWTHLA